MTKNEAGERWAEGLVRRVGLAIKKARGNKSARWLSDETAALGYRVSPTVIAKLDSGHRGSVLSVAELLVLAAALDIPPGLLLFPGYPYDVVEYLPGRAADAHSALDWLSGYGVLPAEAGPGGERRGALPNAGTELVRAMREYIQDGQLLLDFEARSHGADDTEERRLSDQLKRSMADLVARIDNLRPAFEIAEKIEITEKPR